LIVVFDVFELRQAVAGRSVRQLVENAYRRLFTSHLHGAEDAVYAAVGEV